MPRISDDFDWDAMSQPITERPETQADRDYAAGMAARGSRKRSYSSKGRKKAATRRATKARGAY